MVWCVFGYFIFGCKFLICDVLLDALLGIAV